MHAEANAILWAARRGVAVEGQRIYCTHEPCYDCSKMIAQVGIAEVYFSETYAAGRDKDLDRTAGRDLLFEAGVPLYKVAT